MRIDISIIDAFAYIFPTCKCNEFRHGLVLVTCYAIEKRVFHPNVFSFIFLIICTLELILEDVRELVQPHLFKLVVNDQHVKGAKRLYLLRAKFFRANKTYIHILYICYFSTLTWHR